MVKRGVFAVTKCVQSPGKNRFKCNQIKRGSKCGHVVHFTHIFRPIYYFNRLCGHMPFSIVRSSNGHSLEPRVTAFDALWFAISICIYMALATCICWYIKRALLLYIRKPILYFLASTINMLRLVNFLCGLLMLIMDMCNRHSLVNIFNRLTHFDRKVSSEMSSNKSQISTTNSTSGRWSAKVFISTAKRTFDMLGCIALQR